MEQKGPSQQVPTSATVQSSADVTSAAAGWLCAVTAGFAPDGHVLGTDASAVVVQLLLAHAAAGGSAPA